MMSSSSTTVMMAPTRSTTARRPPICLGAACGGSDGRPVDRATACATIRCWRFSIQVRGAAQDSGSFPRGGSQKYLY
eukprot:COSAG01_NODE_3533_length_5962_cov_41.705611_3_plen_77_part_00